MEDAACAGKAPSRSSGKAYRDPWFPERGGQRVDVIEVCFYCPVRRQCGEYRDAIKPQYGIWAGKFQHRGKDVDRPGTKRAV